MTLTNADASHQHWIISHSKCIRGFEMQNWLALPGKEYLLNLAQGIAQQCIPTQVIFKVRKTLEITFKARRLLPCDDGGGG